MVAKTGISGVPGGEGVANAKKRRGRGRARAGVGARAHSAIVSCTAGVARAVDWVATRRDAVRASAGVRAYARATGRVVSHARTPPNASARELDGVCGRAGRAGARVAFFLVLAALGVGWAFWLVRLGSSPTFIGVPERLARAALSGWVVSTLALLIGHEVSRVGAYMFARAVMGFSPEAYAREVAGLCGDVALMRGRVGELSARAGALVDTSYRLRTAESFVWAGRARLRGDLRADSLVVITTLKMVVIAGPHSASRSFELDWRDALGWTTHDHRDVRIHVAGARDVCFRVEGDRRDPTQDPAVFGACMRQRFAF